MVAGETSLRGATQPPLIKGWQSLVGFVNETFDDKFISLIGWLKLSFKAVMTTLDPFRVTLNFGVAAETKGVNVVAIKRPIAIIIR